MARGRHQLLPRQVPLDWRVPLQLRPRPLGDHVPLLPPGWRQQQTKSCHSRLSPPSTWTLSRACHKDGVNKGLLCREGDNSQSQLVLGSNLPKYIQKGDVLKLCFNDNPINIDIGNAVWLTIFSVIFRNWNNSLYLSVGSQSWLVLLRGPWACQEGWEQKFVLRFR